jgi:DcuC family C4-dicarboxylate transporter
VLIFDGKWGPQLHIITILVICMLLAAVLEFVRGFTRRRCFLAWKSLTAVWRMPSRAS